MNHHWRDMIFQAHCQIDYLHDAAENGGRLDGHENGTVEVELGDGSWMSIYLEPIKALVEALERLPAPTPEDAA